MTLEQEKAAFEQARRTMVDGQVRPADVTHRGVIDAMLWAPREAFLPKSKRASAYLGEHLEIAPGRWELDPRLFAKMSNAAAPEKDDLAMVVGSGYGYAAAVLSRMCAAVVALEEDEAMSRAAETAFSRFEIDTVIAHAGPLLAGCAEHAPYNLIFVNGAVGDAALDALQSQLIDGGRMIVIRGDAMLGRAELVVRSGDAFGARDAFDAAAPILPGSEAPISFEF